LRWATRGWTLQELIAPYDVKFFSAEWKLLTSKAEWRCRRETAGTSTSLSDNALLTERGRFLGIPTPVLLKETRLSGISVAHRMSWAAGRRTTRTEDVAYCLLGIFDVKMPLLYGEGRRAFARLQEEIIRTVDDGSILAWHTRRASDPIGGDFYFSPTLAEGPHTFIQWADPEFAFITFSRAWLTEHSIPPTLTAKGLAANIKMAEINRHIVDFLPGLPPRLVASGSYTRRYFLAPVARFRSDEDAVEEVLLQVYCDVRAQFMFGVPELVRLPELEFKSSFPRMRSQFSSHFESRTCYLRTTIDRIPTRISYENFVLKAFPVYKTVMIQSVHSNPIRWPTEHLRWRLGKHHAWSVVPKGELVSKGRCLAFFLESKTDDSLFFGTVIIFLEYLTGSVACEVILDGHHLLSRDQTNWFDPLVQDKMVRHVMDCGKKRGIPPVEGPVLQSQFNLGVDRLTVTLVVRKGLLTAWLEMSEI
jgi:hypothetical protein